MAKTVCPPSPSPNIWYSFVCLYCSNFCCGVMESTLRFQFARCRRSDSSDLVAPVSVSIRSTEVGLSIDVSSMSLHWFHVCTIPTACSSPSKSKTLCEPIGVPPSSPLKKLMVFFEPWESAAMLSRPAPPRGPASRI